VFRIRAALPDLHHRVGGADESAAALAAATALAAAIATIAAAAAAIAAATVAVATATIAAAAATIATIATIATLASAGPAVASAGARDEQRNWAYRWRFNRRCCDRPCHLILSISSPL
jgi:hypothetical protein